MRAATAPNAEVAYRARLVLRKLNADEKPVDAAGRAVRVVRVLERAGTADARALPAKIGEGDFGFAVAPDAKAALAWFGAQSGPPMSEPGTAPMVGFAALILALGGTALYAVRDRVSALVGK